MGNNALDRGTTDEPTTYEFDPGKGWHDGHASEGMRAERLKYRTEYGDWQPYYRPDPVPPLPTEPHTVIRVTWKEGEINAPYVLLTEGVWLDTVLGHRYALDKFKRITGFEVLAEPVSQRQRSYLKDLEQVRRETAKAVLDRVRKVHHSAGDLSIPARFKDELGAISCEFGVES